MVAVDLLSIRQEFDQKRILLCFNGPISSNLIQELGHALKNYLQADQLPHSRSMDVFGVYIELTQNIRHYAQAQGYDDLLGSATVVVGRYDAEHYWVLAGNIVEPQDGLALQQRVKDLATMDKAALRAEYKRQLREPRSADAVTGAGLGLIDIARRVVTPISCDLTASPDGRSFFSLLAVV